ncbi:SusC/RagA family TonB-linked outer membrane protein [Arcticibacter tournemirensis]|uniref:TonB-dependent receptor n=1 Tax=Arcticibacter tournemirensis TaxID=699437 RepID=A0A4Q0M5L4_9SPHI|nr:TonB-dependent receptor [Arcticibacter tournemirensis]RXF68029.1 TonB-dependent receptor [Arcticibacter tournemirensis]
MENRKITIKKTSFPLIVKILLFSLFTLLSCHIHGQNVVKGTVTDSKGETLPGASVVVKRNKQGVTTNTNGEYSIQAAKNDILIVSYVGMVSQEINVGGRSIINVTLKNAVSSLEEVVVVGYGTQRKVSITGSVSQIRGEELLKAPAANLTNLLAGRVAGVTALQQSGQPGSDASSILVRGAGAKLVVDGIPRDFSEIDPNDIATVSVLKDASAAAVYGLDASAVIIVTTKRGQAAPLKLNFTTSQGISRNTQMLQLLDGPQFAYWYNKARELDGNTPVFSQEHVRKMLASEDGWSNTNWYEETFGTGTTAQYNMNASGGTENLKYFASLGYFDQNGNVKNFNYDRINIRSNVDATVTKNLTLNFDFSGRVENRLRATWSSDPSVGGNIAQQAVRALPFVPKEWNGLPVATPTASSIVSPLASSSYDAGYRTDKANIVQTNIALNYDMPFLKGLSARFLVAYDYTDGMSKQFTIPYDVNMAVLPVSPEGNMSYIKTQFPSAGDAGLTEGATRSTTLTTNTSLKYEGKFGLHNVSVLTLAETRKTDGNGLSATGYGFDIVSLDELSFATKADRRLISGSSSQARMAGYLGRLNYSYANKYLLEMTGRYDGTYQFAGSNISGKRWILTPAASLGWRVSEEDWFKKLAWPVNNLKLRGGIGKTALTNGLPSYFYLNTLSIPQTPVAVIGGSAVNGLNTSQPANVNLTWSKALQYNGGFDLDMWKGALGLEFDVFYKYLYDMPAAVSSTVPDSWGGYAYAYENINKQDHKGFEFRLSHASKVNDFSYRVELNGTYTKRRWLHYNDPVNMPDYLKLTGKEVGVLEGFVALGLYQSEEDIINSAVLPSGRPRPGDIKYLDRNGDGQITYEQDRGYVGKSAYPDFTGGFSFYGQWKGIDISFLWQGALGRDIALTGVYPGVGMDNSLFTKAFYHSSNTPLYLVENSWTPDNPNSKFPRLSLTPPGNNNAYSSDFWYRNGDYLRLKSLQIGYNVPGKLLKGTGIGTLRIYAEGQNLLTFSELTKYNIDPEQPGVSNGYYPQQTVFAGGIKLTF